MDLNLSLVSHTNAGKTTLARTLLGRDVGEVRDAPHVTEFADAFTLVETPQGERLQLWDTPGFGDSVRLVKRLRQSANPFGWFMSQVWDRWRDRPFWASQQALRNVRDEADVMLYLVNAAEEPAAAGYVLPEMELLAWVGKPVIVLLNQRGPPREGAAEDAELARWREHLAGQPQVREVLPLDAFARCWVQEFSLLGAIEASLPDDASRALMARLAAVWQQQRWAAFEASMAALAQSLARTATARQPVGESHVLRDALRQIGSALRLVDAEDGAVARARQALSDELDAEVRAGTARLIALHGLEGTAQAEILARLASHFEARLKLGEGKAALWGGMLTGAVAGLKADVLSGGLTMGGGLLLGGVLGALGGAGLARGYNLVRGTEASWLGWSAEALGAMVEAAVLRYLAVAHFGRGRGEWARSEAPAHWKTVVEAALAPQREALAAVWAERDRGDRGGSGDDDMPNAFGAGSDADTDTDAETTRIAAALQPLLRETSLASLRQLYPNTLPDR